MGISPRRSGRSAAATTASSSNPSPPSPRRRRNSLQSYNQSPPPSHQQQNLTSPPPDDDDDDDDDVVEITRCVCGSQEYPFIDAEVEDSGFMISCERCNVWQHGPCVGVMSEKEAPESYFCEECRPDLHELGNRNQGHRQSRWIGSSIHQHQTSRRKRSNTSTHQQGSLKGESLSPDPSDKDANNSNSRERKPSPKKRSTMNSRDAAYDLISLFPGALNATGADEDSKMDDSMSPPASRSGDSRSRRRGGKRLADDDDEDLSPNSRSKRRREGNETEDPNDDPQLSASNASNPRSRTKKSSSKRLNATANRDNDSDIVDASKDDSSSDHQHQGSTTPLFDTIPTSQPSRNGTKRSNNNNGKRRQGAGNGKSDRVDSEEPPTTPTFRRVTDEVIRPARARVPQARSGLNEMRKRVGAILEYVGRLQADVAPSVSDSPNGTPLDDPETYEKPDLDNASSMIIMQYLTKRCLDFEVKFGKYPGRYN